MINPTDYIKNRFEEQNRYSDNNAVKNKQKYYQFKTTELILTCIIPVLTVAIPVDWCFYKPILVTISSVLLFVSSYSVIKNYFNVWVLNRKLNESLKRERIFYETKVMQYDNLDDEAALKLFVVNIENLLASENVEWYQRTINTPINTLLTNKKEV